MRVYTRSSLVAVLGATLAAPAAAQPPTLPLNPALTRSSSTVADGLVHERLNAPSEPGRAAQSIHLLRVDLTRFRLQPVLALEQILGQETTSSMTARRGAVAGINGGFSVSNDPWTLIHGDPNGFFALDGIVVSEPVDDRPALGFCPVARPDAGSPPSPQRLRVVEPRLTVRLAGAPEVAAPIGLNRARGADDLVVYTPEWGRSTVTAAGGVELVVRAGVVRARVASGSSPIPEGGFVLAASGSRVRDLAALPVGARVSLAREVTDRRTGEVVDLAGCSFTSAGPVVVEDGRPRPAPERGYQPSFVDERHPRTAVGATRDGRTALLAVVDGRQPHAAGVTLPELADLMRREGAWWAYNLDGGGSTTLALGGRVVNAPSDGRERRRADAVLVVPVTP